MKKTLLLLFAFFVSITLYSQTENPFAKFGYDVLTASSSKGEFEEFHDQADIVEIGSVLYNTKTNEIVKVLDKNETTIDLSSAVAAMSIDPQCEKYYWISPYAYCANNPIKYVDPTGEFIESAWDVFSLVTGAKSFVDNVKAGNVGAAIVDGLGVVVDAAAVIVPGVPGGVGAAAKGIRAMDNAIDATRTVDKAIDTKKTYQTYTKTNSKTGEVYTGRTSGTDSPTKNVRNRDANHHKNAEGFGKAELDQTSSNSDAIRGREQQMIDKNGGSKSQGGTSGNTINGVSPTNPKKDHYLDEALKQFGAP
jgi:hypothetical protein